MKRFITIAAAALAVILVAPQANALTCGVRDAVFSALARNGQDLTEHGVDAASGVFVGVTTHAGTRAWTFVMSPAGQPRTLCIVGNGLRWTRKPGSSTGVMHDGSVITIIFNEKTGDWQLLYMQSGVPAAPKQSASGHGWERLGDKA